MSIHARGNISNMPQALHMHEYTENPDGYLDANPQWEPKVSDMLTHHREISRIAG